ncbi:MAG: hypothetical protein KGJ02_07995 [Verrucomicrobiota bacterium]|nr:hypothetical protein [Verrucomicrobiota bacterium]
MSINPVRNNNPPAEWSHPSRQLPPIEEGAAEIDEIPGPPPFTRQVGLWKSGENFPLQPARPT